MCLASWQCELQYQLSAAPQGGQEIKNFNFQSIILKVLSVTVDGVEDILTVHMWLHGYSSTSMHGYGCGRTCA